MTFEEADHRLAAGWHVPQKAFPDKNLLLTRKGPSTCDSLHMTSSQRQQAPQWLGWESAQRKRYLRAVEQDLAAELGPDWRDKIAGGAEG